jgi:hypothetical protein
MADIEFYKTQLEKVSAFISEQIHPWYGPCDGFADGNCSECVKVLSELKKAFQQKKELGVPHPILTETTEYYKGMVVLPQILCEVVEVDFSDANTRLHLKEQIEGLDFWIDAVQCRYGLPASVVDVASAVSGETNAQE